MNVSMNWLSDYIQSHIDPDDLAEKISLHAQEVADVRPLYAADGLVLGRVESTEAIPDSKNKRCVVTVNGAPRTIVCGAPNVAPGQDVIVADIGATLPGDVTIQKATINGIESAGMIVSLSELGIDKKYHQETGIHVLNEPQNDTSFGLDDTVVEIELTPNRMDLMSMLGVAYEVSALYKVPLTLPEVTVKEAAKANPYTIESDTPKCMAYYGRVIENVTVQESPEWLKNRLIAAGIRPINTIVDVTNYIMIDLGQPLHAFDSDTIGTQSIRVKTADADTTFQTLDGQTRALKSGDILITDGKRPIALGGVMGGLDTEVTSATTTLFLESAIFDETQIGQTSRRLDLRSEASLRYERGIAHDRAILALNKAATMIQALSGGEILNGIAEHVQTPNTPWTVSLQTSRVNQLLGTTLSDAAIKALLERLQLTVKTTKETLEVTIPPRRLDLHTEQDLIEEVGRLYGYNHLDVRLPSTQTQGYLTDHQKRRRMVKSHLEGLGFFESITYSLTRPDLEEGFVSREPTAVLRPLSTAQQTLKQTVVPGLLEVLSYHHARQMDDVKIYELRNLYWEEEIETLGIAMSGASTHSSWKPPVPVDFYSIKGLVQHVLAMFNVTAEFVASSLEAMHPHQTAEIRINGEVCGFVGKVHPETASQYDLKDIYVAELYITSLAAKRDRHITYEPVTKMQSVRRDLALVVDKTIPAGVLLNTIESSNVPYLIDAEIFDVYTGLPLLDSEKSLAIRVAFNDTHQTFKTGDIDALMNQLLTHLKNEHAVKLRT